MRFFAISALVGLATLGHADRVISVPTARKIPFGTARYEFRGVPASYGRVEHLLGLGIGTSYELELRTSALDGDRSVGTFDLGYNLVAPIPELSPGIAVGIQDALDRTSDGRRGYLAFTFRPVFSTEGGDVYGEVTLGVLQGRYTHPYVGMVAPLSRELRLLVEHNGFRPTAGFEIRLRPELGLRAQFRESQTLVGFQWTQRF